MHIMSRKEYEIAIRSSSKVDAEDVLYRNDRKEKIRDGGFCAPKGVADQKYK